MIKKSRFLFRGACFFVLFIFCVLADARAQNTDIHLYGEETHISETTADFKGNVRFLNTQLQIFAHRMHVQNFLIDDEQEFLIQGTPLLPLQIRSLDWFLIAQQARIWRQQGYIQASEVTLLSRQPRLQLKADQVFVSEIRWNLTQTEVKLPGVPGLFLAAQADYLPTTQTLTLQNVQYQPIEAGPVFDWPDIQWQFKSDESTLRLRPDTARFQPQVRLDNGLEVGVFSELWKTPEQSAYGGLFYGEHTGWRSQGALEWQMTPQSILLTQGSIKQNFQQSDFAFTGATDYFYQTALTIDNFSTQVFTQLGASFQQPNNFLQQFGLPLRQETVNYSGIQTVVTLRPQRAFSERLNALLMLGAQWGSQSRLNSLWQGEWELWRGAGHALLGSAQVHFLYEDRLIPTFAARFTDIWALNDDLDVGAYIEHYASAIPIERFLSSQRLDPWLGGFFRWRIYDDMGLSMDAALNPVTAQWTQLNALLSWRYEGLYLHLGGFLIRDPTLPMGFSGGPQLSIQFVLPGV